MFEASIDKLQPGMYELHILHCGQAIMDSTLHENIEAALLEITESLSEQDAPYLTLTYRAITIRTLSHSELRSKTSQVAQEMVELAACVNAAYA